MTLRPFDLERYFARHEFSAKHLLCASDCEGMQLQQLLGMADEEMTKRWQQLTLGYVDTTGSAFLREEIAQTYLSVDPSHVLCMLPSEAITATMLELLESGDHVVCTWPGYQSLYSIAEDIGCTVDRWEAKESEHGWRFDITDAERLLRNDTKLLVVNFPHNPTGAELSESDFYRLMHLAKQRGIQVFSDEMYRDPDRTFGLPAACDLYANAISLSGMSKLYGLGGIRLGWLVIRDEETRRRVWAYRDYLSNGGPAASEVLGTIALRARKDILLTHAHRIGQNMDAFQSFIGRHEHLFSWTPPAAGHVALVRMCNDVSALAFCDKVVAECGVMLLPSTVYGMDDRHFRVGFGREDFLQSLYVFGKYLREHPDVGVSPNTQPSS